MNRVVRTGLITAAALVALAHPSAAQKPQSPDIKAQRIDACSLLTPAQIKEYLPWEPMFDRIAGERDDIGDTGSACGYPTVHIQVLRFTPSFIEAARKGAKLEPVSGLGDEAHVRHNRAGYAEVFVKVGTRLLTVQANIPNDGTFESVKSKAIALAKALVAKLKQA